MIHKTLIAAVLLASTTLAGDVKLSKRGALLFSEDFSGAALASEWKGKPGKWEVHNGVVIVSEVKEDKHVAVRRHPLSYHDAIIELWFEMDGANAVHISLNSKDGHVCRVIVNKAGMTLQLDRPLPVEKLVSSPVQIEQGKWHKLVFEVRGRKMIAQLDDNAPISAENVNIDVDKIDIGLPVGGVSAQLKGLKVFAPLK